MSSLLDRLKQGIQKTRSGLVGSLDNLIHGHKEIDPDLLEELEYSLIGSDIGVKTTTEILESIRQRVERQQLSDAGELRSMIRQQLLDILEANERPMKSFLLAAFLIPGRTCAARTIVSNKQTNGRIGANSSGGGDEEASFD